MLTFICCFLWSKQNPNKSVIFTSDNTQKDCGNFVKELVILFHRTAAAPWGHVAYIIKRSSTGDSLFFRGIPTGTEAFLEPPVVSRLGPCARAYLKKCFARHSSGRLKVRQIWPGNWVSWARRNGICYLSQQHGVDVLTTNPRWRTWGLRPYQQPKQKTWKPTNHSRGPSSAEQTNLRYFSHSNNSSQS